MAGIDNNTLLYLRGDTFEDLSLNPKTIANNGVTIVEDGLFGSCFNFNGSSNYVNIDNMSFYDLDSFTIDFYLTLNNLNTRQTIFRQDSDTSGNRSNPSIHLSIELNKVLRFAIYNSSNTEQLFTYTYPYSTLIDTHIEISRKSNNLYLFINGKLILNKAITIGNIRDLSVPLALGRYGNYNGVFLNGKIYGFNIVNYCKHTEDFTPPTQPYNSININKTNQTDTNIEFNVEKLGQETINKVEVLVNDTVSETYSDNYDSINYLIDKSLIYFGNNNITIKVTFDDVYTEELSLTHKVTVDELPLETPLLDTVERVKLLTKSKQNEKTMLSSILTSKNVEVSEEDKMSDLIGKVDLFENYVPPIKFIYDEGNEFTDFTGGLVVNRCSTVNKNDIKVTKYDNYFDMVFSWGGGSPEYRDGWFISTTNAIDRKTYTKLKVEFEKEGFFQFAIGINSNNTSVSVVDPIDLAKTTYVGNSISENMILTCDITNTGGLRYPTVVFYIMQYSSGFPYTGRVRLKKIWLEK